jgi:ComF family protein
VTPSREARGTNPLRALLSATTDFLLTPSCLACHAPLPPSLSREGSLQLLCPQCRDLLHPIAADRQCPRCGASPVHPPRLKGAPADSCLRCESLPPGFNTAIAAFPYLSSAGLIVRNMKYSRSPWLAAHLVEIAWPHVGERLTGWIRSDPHLWVVVPSPMHGWRELRRGYNQAVEIARPIARLLRLELLPRALSRRRRTPPQARFHDREKRLENLRTVFECTQPGKVAGRSVLLVDDVMTSGATMVSAGQALLDAGATRVHVFVLLRAQISEEQAEGPKP